MTLIAACPTSRCEAESIVRLAWVRPRLRTGGGVLPGRRGTQPHCDGNDEREWRLDAWPVARTVKGLAADHKTATRAIHTFIDVSTTREEME